MMLFQTVNSFIFRMSAPLRLPKHKITKQIKRNKRLYSCPSLKRLTQNKQNGHAPLGGHANLHVCFHLKFPPSALFEAYEF